MHHKRKRFVRGKRLIETKETEEHVSQMQCVDDRQLTSVLSFFTGVSPKSSCELTSLLGSTIVVVAIACYSSDMIGIVWLNLACVLIKEESYK